MYINITRFGRKKKEKKIEACGQSFSERYGLLKEVKQKSTIIWETADIRYNQYLLGTTRSVSRVLVWGNGNGVARMRGGDRAMGWARGSRGGGGC